jgi:hypothetical protein
MSGGVKVARETISVVVGAYGAFSGPGMNLPRARVWVLAEPGSNFGTLRVAYNDAYGRVQWRDLDDAVVSARIGANRWMLSLASGQAATLTPAPCVCGAGAVGLAGPSGSPHTVAVVRGDQLPWITLG